MRTLQKTAEIPQVRAQVLEVAHVPERPAGVDVAITAVSGVERVFGASSAIFRNPSVDGSAHCSALDH